MTSQRSGKAPAQKERAWSLDLLRILATFAVVTLHTNPFSIEVQFYPSLSYWISNVISSACRFAVPVFFMISGALYLSPHKELSTGRLYRRTILRMAVSYLFWSGVYALSYCFHTGTGKWTFINETLRGHYHLWFIFAITALYILTPLLRQITRSREATRYLLLLCLVFGFLLPRAMDFLLLFPLPHRDVFESLQSLIRQLNPLSGSYTLFYYTLGYVLFANPPGRRLRIAIAAGGVIGFLMTILLGAMHLHLTGVFSSHFYDAPAIGAMLMGVAAFVCFTSRFAAYRPKALAGRIIRHLSACSYGVYAAHILFLEHIERFYPLTPFGRVADILAYSLMIYALAHAVSATLHRIPVLRNWVV